MSEFRNLTIKLREIIKSYYPHKFDENGKFTILLIDDSSIARQNLIDSLSEAELFNFIEAENGMEGLYKLGQFGEQIGFICLDMEMPIMNGMDFYIKSKEANLLKNIPVIMVTSIAEKKKVIELIKAGVNSYILKPFSPIDFLNNVIRILTEHRKTQTITEQQQQSTISSAKDIYEKHDEALGFKTGKITEEAKKKILDNPDDNKIVDEKVIEIIKNKETQQKSVSLFFINERLKALMSELFIDYLQKTNFIKFYFDDFINFVRIKMQLQKKCLDIINMFDGKGLLSAYLSSKDLFNNIYHKIMNTKGDYYDLERTEEIQMAITLYLYEYWRHIIIDYIKQNFYMEFIKMYEYLVSINASEERKYKQYEQLIINWKKIIAQSNQITLENLQKTDSAQVKTKLT